MIDPQCTSSRDGEDRTRATLLCAHAGDPLGILIVDRLALSPLRAALVALAAALIVDTISFALVGAQVIQLSGWADGWAYAVYLYLVFPTIVGAYVWSARAVSALFYDLQQSQALVAPEREYGDLVGALRARYRHRGWSAAAMLITGVIAVYYAVVFTRGWPHMPRYLRALKVVLLYAPGWYMVCQIVAREIVTIWGLRQVFRRFQVSPHPLHPDRCGGLRAINNYAVGFTYIIAIAGIGVGLMVYSTVRREGRLSPDMSILTLLYVLVALLCFFLPPLTAHSAMEQAKRRLLSEISRQFQHDYAEATAQLGSKSDELEARVEKVQNLHTLYEMTDAFAVWPFDTATLRRFVVAVTVPLVPAAIELAVTIGSALLRSE